MAKVKKSVPIVEPTQPTQKVEKPTAVAVAKPKTVESDTCNEATKAALDKLKGAEKAVQDLIDMRQKKKLAVPRFFAIKKQLHEIVRIAEQYVSD